MRKIYNLVYKISEGVRYGVFIKVDEPILKKIINKEIDYNDFCISLTKKQIMHNGKRVDFEVFTIDLINESIITKDNIHLYYEFMSDEDMKKNAIHYEKIGHKRIDEIKKSLNLNEFYDVFKGVFTKPKMGTDFKGREIAIESSYFYELECFGIKDTLKPIDEYIAEIKASKEYQVYISSKLA